VKINAGLTEFVVTVSN